MNLTDSSAIGKEYKGFVVVDINDVPDYKSKAVYLRHKTTGLEVYHLINKDNENLFSFCFRTVAKDSKGAAHITEHSVLCGSEKFPLKEPFNTLDQQSLKTFLNAMTYPEKTLYPAASVVKSDYYNLMDVYADAVFFPKLSRQTFMQEGWRVELDEKGKASLQGVVYNEMKANYSSFNSIAIDLMFSELYPDSIMDFDSGGDPLKIPELTYEDFIAFHKKFYNPSNCLVFLYGNIPTEEQLDFLCEKYIPRLEKTYGTVNNLDLSSKLPYVNPEIKEIQSFKRITETKSVKAIGPDNGATGNMVALGYYLGPKNIEQTFLAEVLCGNDSSPMTKKIKASQLGEDEAPVNGTFGYVQEDCVFCYGLSGVKSGNEDKVYEIIPAAFKEIYEEGIPQKAIDSAIMGIDFTLREENRNFGPGSISIMSRAAASWSVGEKPVAYLNRISDFEEVKEQIKNNPDYVKEMIKKYFLDAEVVLKFTAEPSKKYFEERNKKEKETLKAFEQKLDKNQLKKDLDQLHEYQGRLETEEELKCIPHLSIKDLQTDVLTIDTEYTTVPGNGSEIPLLINKQNTNGIVYFDLLFPIDKFKPEEVKYLNLFCDFFDNLGRKNKDWSECLQEETTVFGDFGVRLNLVSNRNSIEAKAEIKNYPNQNIANRNYIIMSVKFLNEVLPEALDLFSEIVNDTEYKDVEHAKILFNENMNELNENFVNNAYKYLSLYTKKTASQTDAIRELIFGISNYFYMKSIKTENMEDLLNTYSKLYEELKNQGALLHLIADEETCQKVIKLLPDFVKKANLKELSKVEEHTIEEYLNKTYSPENNDSSKTTYLMAPAQAGYSVFTTNCSAELTKEVFAETILASYLNGHQIWEKIRMQGGAYGGKCGADGRNQLFVATSWRDPTPEKSLKIYLESLEEAMNFDFSQEDIERCILSEYSEYIVPDCASGLGGRGMMRYLTGYTNEQFKKEIELLLSITPEDVHKAAERLYKNAVKKNSTAVFCDNSINCCGNIIKIIL